MHSKLSILNSKIINKNNAYKRETYLKILLRRTAQDPAQWIPTEANGSSGLTVSHNPLSLTAASLLCSMGRACPCLFLIQCDFSNLTSPLAK